MDISFYDAIQVNSKLHMISWNKMTETGSFLYERVKLDLGHYADELCTKYHRHQNLEIHLCLNGCINLSVEETGESVLLGEDSFIMFSPGSVHSIDSHSENMIKLGMRFDVSDTCCKDVQENLLGCGYVTGNLDQHTIKILSMLIDQCSLTSSSTENVLHYLIMTLTYDIARLIQTNHNKWKNIKSGHDQMSTYVRNAILYIHENIQQSLNCQMVADYVGFSVRHLNRMMIAEAGISINHLIIRTRHDLARQLLLDTKLSIARISELMSFSSEYNFSHFFKRLEGLSPTDFRLNNKNRMS